MQIEIFLVPYGYQVDVYDRSWATKGGDGIRHSMECRDFGGDYRITTIAACATDAILKAMQKLERSHLETAPTDFQP